MNMWNLLKINLKKLQFIINLQKNIQFIHQLMPSFHHLNHLNKGNRIMEMMILNFSKIKRKKNIYYFLVIFYFYMLKL